jgi:hypothetical protein
VVSAQSAETTSGDGVLYDGRNPLELAFPGDMRSVSVVLSRDLLPLHSNAMTGYCARKLAARSPAMRLLAGYVTELRELGPSLTEAQRHDAGYAAAELIGMALRDLGRIDPSLGEGRDVLLGTMRRYVRAHLADSRLSVAELARQHHTCTRCSPGSGPPQPPTSASSGSRRRVRCCTTRLMTPVRYRASPRQRASPSSPPSSGHSNGAA